MMEVDYVRVYQRKVASNEDEQNDKNANVKTVVQTMAYTVITS